MRSLNLLLFSQERKTFADVFCEGILSGKIDLTEEEIRAEAKSVVLPAIETVSPTLAYALKLLSILPEVQLRAQSEVDDVFQGTDRRVSSEDLRR